MDGAVKPETKMVVRAKNLMKVIFKIIKCFGSGVGGVVAALQYSCFTVDGKLLER